MTGPGIGFEAALTAAIDGKTKPPGSLGRIEELAAQIARLQGSLTPRMETCRHIIFAADHGLALEGVSAFPQAVTREMVRNFLAGGAASNVFARVNGVDLTVVDAGVAGEPLEADRSCVRTDRGRDGKCAFRPGDDASRCRAGA